MAGRQDDLVLDLTKKNEPEIKKDDWISLQLEAMGESIHESLTKRQQYGCLHEMQAVVFRYVSSQLDRQERQQMAPQMLQPMAVPPCSSNRTISWRGYRNLLYTNL